uniref:tRNA (adenine(58)-N(1))-methyltransferase non-catalytic subunit TRM6 n=1 Tax=Panagrellus redivivus TaxID=6233 RepID=A0A7E4V0R8_PANRE
MSTIELNRYVVVRKQSGDLLRLVKVTKGAYVVIEKLRFSLANAIGKPFGLFEVRNGEIRESLTPQAVAGGALLGLNNFRPQKRSATEETGDEPPEKVVQKLTEEEIVALKEEGTAVDHLVTQLVEGNVNFDKRTNFSKEKYIAKKQKHHSDKVFIIDPTLRLIATALFRRGPEHIAYLRPDLLAQILHHSALIFGGKALVYEESSGLIAAAVMQRFEGKGEMYYLHRGVSPTTHQALHAMNFNPLETAVFRPIKLSVYLDLINRPVDTPMPTAESELTNDSTTHHHHHASDNNNPTNSHQDLREAEIAEQLFWIRDRLIDSAVMDALILAGDSVSVAQLLEKTYHCLRTSGAVVVYANIQEEVVQVVQYLEKQNAICILVQEQMCREVQVLKDRCHPALQTPVSGGYFVTAYKTL